MKIMVTGIGGIGGYMASFLCAYYDDVTLIARRKRKESLIEKGL
ncbi:MAG: 2-dehydropantoate 2-reductase N-terminal domain-containing protein, partial [Caecibacter massiliensis]|nr:2-dehydropantoate 2-reductase N-terminal domain-containing protein [Caecibacter massiliensis]